MIGDRFQKILLLPFPVWVKFQLSAKCLLWSWGQWWGYWLVVAWYLSFLLENLLSFNTPLFWTRDPWFGFLTRFFLLHWSWSLNLTWVLFFRAPWSTHLYWFEEVGCFAWDGLFLDLFSRGFPTLVQIVHYIGWIGYSSFFFYRSKVSKFMPADCRFLLFHCLVLFPSFLFFALGQSFLDFLGWVRWTFGVEDCYTNISSC